MNAYIKNGWAGAITDPDGIVKATTSKTSTSCVSDIPGTEAHVWKPLKECVAHKDSHPLVTFSNSQIITYFVTRTAVDGLPANDLKAINTSAQHLFKCGHVQDIKFMITGHLAFQAKCIPAMRKDRIYKLSLLLDKDTLDVEQAECGCPAGKGPFASCKHVAALCYALEEFSRFGRVPEFLTSTEKLQQWNQPRPKKLEIIPVAELSSRRDEILKKKNDNVLFHRTYDPRPVEYRIVDNAALEGLRCDLQSLNQRSAFLDILMPSKEKVEHDHTYSSPSGMPAGINKTTITANHSKEFECSVPSYPINDHDFKNSCMEVKTSLNLSCCERKSLEMETRDQSSQPMWHVARSKRITASKCGKILCQKTKTVSLLRQCVYPKPLLHPPVPIAWGRQHESIAIKKYTSHKNESGSTVSVDKCGFIVHPTKGWLGASPDGRVQDSTCSKPNGALEVKCPYSKRDQTPEEACSDSNFFCELVNSEVNLKHDHSYYHQVQLQLYVGTDLYDWCDFCVYTCKGVSTQRIFQDEEWQLKNIPELEMYFDTHIAPELVSCKYKPSYIL